jgi:uncharacterized NAD(P)/FAD-binding protein YdhS
VISSSEESTIDHQLSETSLMLVAEMIRHEEENENNVIINTNDETEFKNLQTEDFIIAELKSVKGTKKTIYWKNCCF